MKVIFLILFAILGLLCLFALFVTPIQELGWLIKLFVVAGIINFISQEFSFHNAHKNLVQVATNINSQLLELDLRIGALERELEEIESRTKHIKKVENYNWD